jgi:prevent-host-death family protein
MNPNKTVKPISDLIAHTSELIQEVITTQQAVIITQYGEAKIVLQDIRSYERMNETLALLKLLLRSKQNIARGQCTSFAATFNNLDKRIAELKNSL